MFFPCHADDTKLYLSFSPGNKELVRPNLKKCIEDLLILMSRNRLKLNENKMEEKKIQNIGVSMMAS